MCAGVCWMDQCVQGCPFDFFEWVCFVHVGVYRPVFVALAGIGTCMGMGVGLVSVSLEWFLHMLNHVFHALQKLWLSFQTPHQMKNQTDTAMQCYQNFTLLDKFIVSFIQFLKSQITWNTFNVYETGTFFCLTWLQGGLLPD